MGAGDVTCPMDSTRTIRLRWLHSTLAGATHQLGSLRISRSGPHTWRPRGATARRRGRSLGNRYSASAANPRDLVDPAPSRVRHFSGNGRTAECAPAVIDPAVRRNLADQ